MSWRTHRNWRVDAHYPTEVTGILLRYALVVVMDGVTRPTSVAELVESVEALGVTIPERKGKWVSDALRTEHKKGRILRVRRDRYVGTDVPRSTRYRAMRSILDHRRRVQEIQEWTARPPTMDWTPEPLPP